MVGDIWGGGGRTHTRSPAAILTNHCWPTTPAITLPHILNNIIMVRVSHVVKLVVDFHSHKFVSVVVYASKVLKSDTRLLGLACLQTNRLQ